MERYNLENLFCILEQFLQKLQHNNTWYIEKDEVQEILTVRKRVTSLNSTSANFHADATANSVVKLEVLALPEIVKEVEEELESRCISDDDLKKLIDIEENHQHTHEKSSCLDISAHNWPIWITFGHFESHQAIVAHF